MTKQSKTNLVGITLVIFNPFPLKRLVQPSFSATCFIYPTIPFVLTNFATYKENGKGYLSNGFTYEAEYVNCE